MDLFDKVFFRVVIWVWAVIVLWIIIQKFFSFEVADSQDIGVGLEMRSHQKWYGNYSEIVTDKGTFLIEGNFILIKNNPLVLQTFKSGQQQICDNKINKCASIKE